MATRRPVAPQDPISQPASSAPAPQDQIHPSVPTATILKLALFTVAMFAAPLSAYFISVRTFFSGNATYAGALAAFVANVVLIAFVIVAMYEDQGDDEGKGRRDKEKKGE